MAYGEIKVDTVTFTDGGIDKSVSISGLVQNPTFSGNITVTGTISGNTVQGQTVSGATVTGNVGSFSTITGGTVTLTSGVFGTGTAAAPSIAFTGDSNTGIYSPGADQVAVATNGVGRLFVDASGNVLINDSASVTSNVTGYLRIRQVNAASDTSIAIINAQNSDANATVKIQAGQFTRRGGEIVFGRENGGDLTNVNVADGYIAFSPVLNGANTERLRITSAGLVGIGSSDPADKLEVVGDIRLKPASGANTLINFEYNNGLFAQIRGNGRNGSPLYGDLEFWTKDSTDGAPVERMVVSAEGRVGIGTTAPGTVLHCSATDAVLTLQGTRGTGASATIGTGGANSQNLLITAGTDLYYRGASQLFQNVAGTTEYGRWDSSGRLLVGTSTAVGGGSSSAGIASGCDFYCGGSRAILFANKITTSPFGSSGPLLLLMMELISPPYARSSISTGASIS
jgi:hypothetical protein